MCSSPLALTSGQKRREVVIRPSGSLPVCLSLDHLGARLQRPPGQLSECKGDAAIFEVLMSFVTAPVAGAAEKEAETALAESSADSIVMRPYMEDL